MRRLGKVFWVGLLGLVVTGMTLWGMGALYYSPLPTLLRSVLACPCPPRQQVSTRNTEAGAATYRLATDIL